VTPLARKAKAIFNKLYSSQRESGSLSLISISILESDRLTSKNLVPASTGRKIKPSLRRTYWSPFLLIGNFSRESSKKSCEAVMAAWIVPYNSRSRRWMVAYFKLSDMRGTRPAGFDTLAGVFVARLDSFESNAITPFTTPSNSFGRIFFILAQNFVRDPNGHSRARTESSATACWRWACLARRQR